jgi:hypothetical protein
LPDGARFFDACASCRCANPPDRQTLLRVCILPLHLLSLDCLLAYRLHIVSLSEVDDFHNGAGTEKRQEAGAGCGRDKRVFLGLLRRTVLRTVSSYRTTTNAGRNRSVLTCRSCAVRGGCPTLAVSKWCDKAVNSFSCCLVCCKLHVSYRYTCGVKIHFFISWFSFRNLNFGTIALILPVFFAQF